MEGLGLADSGGVGVVDILGWWFTRTVHSPLSPLGASLVMGVAVTAMHYTGMAAAHVTVDPGAPTPAGASGMDFIVPMTVLLGSYLFLAWAFVALSPTSGARTTPARLPGPAAASTVRTTPTSQNR